MHTLKDILGIELRKCRGFAELVGNLSMVSALKCSQIIALLSLRGQDKCGGCHLVSGGR